MKIDILTIFPEYFAPLELALIGKAQINGLLEINLHNIRDFAKPGVHQSVDDSPIGGGAGMVMLPEVVGAAIDSVIGDAQEAPLLIFPTPRGKVLNQNTAQNLSTEKHLVFVCGRYEGIDERVYEYYSKNARSLEISIGDYILAGAEVAALTIIETTTRLLPGVVHNPESLQEESHSLNQNGKKLLEYPLYTHPKIWRDLEVPEVLYSGNHAKIAEFRQNQAIQKTEEMRPDMLK